MLHLRRAALALSLAAAPACAGGAEPGPALPPLPSEQPEPPPLQLPEADLAPPAGVEGAVTQITARDRVPLQGPRVEARPGDWMITNAGMVAVVNAQGVVVDFGPAGSRDELGAVHSMVQLALDGALDDVASIEAVAGSAARGKALRVVQLVRGQPIALVTWIWLSGKVLQIESAAAGTGQAVPGDTGPIGAPQRLPALAVTLGERVSWGNVPTWAEGHGFVWDAGIYPTDFLAREGFGVAYAACAAGGRMLARFGEQELAGFYEPGVTGEEVVPVPHHGASARRRVSVAHSAVSAGDAVLALPCVRGGGTARVALPALAIAGARVEVARCDATGGAGRPFAHFSAAAARSVELPAGCHRARLAAPGHAPGAWVDAAAIPAQLPEVLLPKSGRLRFAATERGQPVPARLVVRGAAGTPDPHWGDEANGGLALNVAHAEKGQGEVPLPPGVYRVLVTRGFEYTAHAQEITVAAGQTVEVRAALERVVDTTGWVAADLHLHAEPSPDAPSRLADRVRSLAAAGVEVAVATDHNAVTDYAPVIRELGLKDAVASVIGDEVTTNNLRWGHFNVFPLAPGAPPLPWLGVLPAEIFAAARAQKPHGRSTIIQVNHPRMGNIGYFDVLRMDPSDVKGWLRRAPLADLEFDALEVFNGDHYDRIHRVEAVMRDWYALLNGGFRVVATGNSDSHKVTFHEPGTPRTLVQTGRDAPGAFDERAFIDALRGGRVVVSSGPFVRLEIAGQGIGSTVPAGDAEIVVRVDAPPWVEIDRVDLVRRGETWKTWSVAAKPGQGPVEQRARETLRKGDWVIAVARGSKAMEHLHRPGARPFGFTNPIFVQ